MQNQKLRQIVYFDLNLTTSPAGRLPPMIEIASFLKERVDAGLCVRLIEAERFLISIIEARIIKKGDGTSALAMLFVFADPDAADPANMHLTTREVRRFAKKDGEGRAVSAHALMDLTPRVFGGGTFRVLLENADRLGKTRVRAELARQFRQIFADKEVTVEDDNGDDVPARPKVDMDAVASDRLRQGIKDGNLKEVRLIDTRAFERGFDAPEPVHIRRREMSLKVDVPVGQTVEKVLDTIKPWAKDAGFDEMYVRWVPAPAKNVEAQAPQPEPEKAKINLAQDDIGETLYARKEFVTLTEPLSDLCERFSDELLGAMVEMLR